jgi:PKD repeat protein
VEETDSKRINAKDIVIKLRVYTTIAKSRIGRLASGAHAINLLEGATTLIVMLVLAFMAGTFLSAFVSVGVEGDLPVASFAYSPKAPILGGTVTFNASESYDSDGYIVGYEWNFGDGIIVTETNPVTTHIYDEAGYYTVKLTVTDNDSLTNTGTKPIIIAFAITLDPFACPVANFTYKPQHPCVNKTITFDASASYDTNGYIVSYYWEFGDGTNSTSMIVDHSYVDVGHYTVRLTVTNNNGLFSILLQSLSVASDIGC